jgi:hypothetical protein
MAKWSVLNKIYATYTVVLALFSRHGMYEHHSTPKHDTARTVFRVPPLKTYAHMASKTVRRPINFLKHSPLYSLRTVLSTPRFTF